jgi:hypothetical protein
MMNENLPFANENLNGGDFNTKQFTIQKLIDHIDKFMDSKNDILIKKNLNVACIDNQQPFFNPENGKKQNELILNKNADNIDHLLNQLTELEKVLQMTKQSIHNCDNMKKESNNQENNSQSRNSIEISTNSMNESQSILFNIERYDDLNNTPYFQNSIISNPSEVFNIAGYDDLNYIPNLLNQNISFDQPFANMNQKKSYAFCHYSKEDEEEYPSFIDHMLKF